MLNCRKYSALENLPEAYKELFEYAGETSLFLTLSWFQNYIKTVVAPNVDIVIYGIENTRDSNRPVGALILEKPRRGERRLLQMNSLSNYYSSLYAPIIDDRRISGQEIVEIMVEALSNDRSEWDMLTFHPLEKSDALFDQLKDALVNHNFLIQSYFAFANLYLKIDNRSSEAYIASLPSKLRKSIPYYDRRLKKEGAVRYELITELCQVDQGVEDYFAVYNSSWREQEPYPEFVKGLVRTAAENGWLRLGLIYLDDRPISAQIWIVVSGTASIYKVCYDEELSKISVGTLLTAFMMRHVIDIDNVEIVDYLTGEEDYKKKWMSDRRERWGLVAFNTHSFRGLVAGLYQVWGRAAKRMFTRSTPKSS